MIQLRRIKPAEFKQLAQEGRLLAAQEWVGPFGPPCWLARNDDNSFTHIVIVPDYVALPQLGVVAA